VGAEDADEFVENL